MLFERRWRAIVVLILVLFSCVPLYFNTLRIGTHFDASEAQESMTLSGQITRKGALVQAELLLSLTC